MSEILHILPRCLLFQYFESFSHQRKLIVSLWSLNNSKRPAVVWMVSISPIIYKSSSPFIIPFVSVLSVPITIGITVNFMFRRFCSSPASSKYLFLFAFFQFYPVISRIGKVHYSTGSLSSYLKIPDNFMRLIFLVHYGLCIYHLFEWSNLNYLHNSQWITFPPSCS